MMQIWENHSKKIIAVASMALLIWGVFAYRNRQYIPKNSDEFFKRNPHLTRSINRVSVNWDGSRFGDKFQEGDYQLLSGYTYPIDFSDTAKFTQATQPEVAIESSGKVWLKSLGLQNGRLVVLAEFQLNKSKDFKKIPSKVLDELGISNNPDRAPTKAQILQRSVLVKLDPRGIVREMYVSNPKVSQASLETRLKTLEKIFKSIPSLKSGIHNVTEIDDQGYPYPMKYTISDSGPNVLIQASASQNYGMHENESKAAAAGAQGFGQMALKGNQAATLDMTWSKKEQRPLQQNSTGNSELSIQNQLIAKMNGTSKVLWGAAEADSNIEKMAQLFTHPIDVTYLRAMLRLKSKQKIETAKNKSKTPEKLTEKQIQQERFKQMSEDLKNNPAQIAHFHQMGMSAPSGSEQMSMVLGSLGYEASEESQKALIEIFSRSDLKAVDREKILTELTLAEQALSEDTKKFLKTLFEKEDYAKSRTAKQAGLALGSSIARDGDPETIEYLHNQWNNISSMSKDASDKKSRQRFLLASMGNAKSNVFMNEARQASNSSDPSLREAAVDSIRFSQSTDSRDLLFGLLGDKDPEVRTMVAKSLRYQPFDQRTQSALQSCAADQETGVKLSCYRVLAANINQLGIREFLSGRLGSESDPQVQKTLQEALSSESTSANP